MGMFKILFYIFMLVFILVFNCICFIYLKAALSHGRKDINQTNKQTNKQSSSYKGPDSPTVEVCVEVFVKAMYRRHGPHLPLGSSPPSRALGGGMPFTHCYLPDGS